MNLAIIAPKTDINSWVKQFNSISKDINIFIWPDIPNYDIIVKLLFYNFHVDYENFKPLGKILFPCYDVGKCYT